MSKSLTELVPGYWQKELEKLDMEAADSLARAIIAARKREGYVAEYEATEVSETAQKLCLQTIEGKRQQ